MAKKDQKSQRKKSSDGVAEAKSRIFEKTRNQRFRRDD